MLSYFEIFAPNPPPPVGWGWGGANKNIDFLDSSWNVWHLKCLPIKLPTPGSLRPPLVGGGKQIVIDFLNSSWNLPDFWNLDPQPPPPGTPPPRVGWVKTNCIDFLDSSWHFPDFWFFDPLKFPLRPPLVGGGKFFYRFSRQFMKFTGLLKFWPPTPPLEPPLRVGWVKTNVLIFWTVHDITRTFDFLTP